MIHLLVFIIEGKKKKKETNRESFVSLFAKLGDCIMTYEVLSKANSLSIYKSYTYLRFLIWLRDHCGLCSAHENHFMANDVNELDFITSEKVRIIMPFKF